jgi:hypothetical protein
VLAGVGLFGLRVLLHPGSRYVGTGADPQIFIWSFAWWPHAIVHGENPIVSHAIWAPDGVNLAWTTTVPGLAVLFSPLTAAIGAVAAYDVAAVLMPALAAWTAFLLCRRLTRQLWPSLVGGYLYGFSSYVAGQEEGHLHASAVFLVPLVALVVLRHVDGELDAQGLVLRLGPLLALQLLFSTELLFTLTLALGCALVLALVFVPARRRRLVSALAPVAVSYVLAALLTAPFDYYLVTGFHSEAFHPPSDFVADLANVVVPTQITLAGHGWAGSIARHFPANDSERGAYLGAPAVVVVALYAWSRLRAAGGRFLVASLLLALLASLGATLTIDGHRSLSLPWAHVGYLPLFDNVLVVRLALYTTLAAAVAVALWTASRTRGVLRWALPALCVLAIVPNPAATGFATSFGVPRFFTDGDYRTCLARGENILPLPVTFNGSPNLWQVKSGFRFTMAGGYVFSGPPDSFLKPPAVASIATGNTADTRTLRVYLRQKHITSVVVDEDQRAQWAPALDRIAKPHDVGGVVLYRITAGRQPRAGAGDRRRCPAPR